MFSKPRIIYISLVLTLLASHSALAQFEILPIISQKETPGKKKPNSNSRNEEILLTLPFWDDFSTPGPAPDTALWAGGENVWVNYGMGIDPPTLGVATFDGIRANGQPYSNEQFTNGRADSLMSHPIDLSLLTTAERQTTFISFFFQAKGHGEIPDPNDSIRLEFKDNNGDWRGVWSAVGGPHLDPKVFYQVILPLNQASYFHSEFQFVFRNFGRVTGPYDAWNIDYVYLNKSRSINDTAYPDRALSMPGSSPFKNYWSVPMTHILEAGNSGLDFIKAQAYNMDDILQVSNFTVLANLDIINSDSSAVQVEDVVEFEKPSSFLTGNARINLATDNLLDLSLWPADPISAELSVNLFINSGDNDEDDDYDPEVFSPIDFRVNDTITTHHEIKDYYAYDDGTAEFGASLTLAGDIFAYRFEMLGDEPDTIVSVDIYFPTIGLNPGSSIEMSILRDLDDAPGSQLLSQVIQVNIPEELNVFHTYPLSFPIGVQGEFYIGFKHPATDVRISFGLDKNNDSSDEVFVNFNGNWTLNDQFKGSLMIRPRFGEGAGPISSIPLQEVIDFNIYPNPAKAHFTIDQAVDDVQLLDLQGKVIPTRMEGGLNQTKVFFDNAKPGLYLVRILKSNQLQTKKLLISH